jgi:predicted RNA polymerase sigma factor
MIAEGLALLAEAIPRGAVGEYQLQAAIAAEHARAPSAAATDWREIAGIYGLLEQMTGSPVVALNRAIAVAMAEGPGAGLVLLDELDDRLEGHHRLHASRAHLLEMSGDAEAAIAAYDHAAARTSSLPEQRYLTKQAARLRARSREEDE